MKRGGAIGLVMAVAALAATGARASEVKHPVRPGDTLDGLARHYYGASWKAVYLSARNGIGEGGALTPGQVLVVPASWQYQVRKGDSLASIAQRYLGSKTRYKAILQHNGIRDAGAIDVGRTLLMPFHLYHVIQRGEDYAQIARRYYRTTRQAGLLKDYNDSEDPRPGQKVVVPVFDASTLAVAAKGAPPEIAKAPPQPTEPQGSSAAPAPRRAPPPAPASADATRLRQALNHYRRGDFDVACRALEEMLDELHSDAEQRAEVIQHLGYCAVAMGDPGAARDYFRSWLALEPNAQLDPFTTSPKILEVFNDVAAQVRKQ